MQIEIYELAPRNTASTIFEPLIMTIITESPSRDTSLVDVENLLTREPDMDA